MHELFHVAKIRNVKGTMLPYLNTLSGIVLLLAQAVYSKLMILGPELLLGLPSGR